ncbi:bacteriocin-like WGxF protein [Bacillus thuringiensis]|uniref:bacteriocin-like WGxF protein n=1 Tax=Bacillus thuringiensis TaxID=1428 RepID=UPI000BA254D8|nr:bacteriocin-like WGxF protein [Bacillus thuringiensis]
MKIVGLTLINCILILFTVLIHKIIYRVLLLGYASLTMYWLTFITIFFLLNLLTNIVFLKDSNR